MKIDLDEELVRRFKKTALEQYGYKKGSIKKAMEALIRDYTREGTADWTNIVGILEGRTETSVELQHKAWSLTYSHS
ncbi:MAG: hypothetical protein ACYCT2_09220 [Thermoplasmataceae archaeon]